MPFRNQLWPLWQIAWDQIDAEPDPTAFTHLMYLYDEAHRHYHNQRHLLESLQCLVQHPDHEKWQGTATIALFYHDAIYAPMEKDNEERSAKLAKDILTQAEAQPEDIDQVVESIIATQHHQSTTDPITNIVLDSDIAILGAEPKRFEEYEQQIRTEYIMVDEQDYRKGRLEVLEKIVQRDQIYNDSIFIEQFEENARKNLSQSIQKLKSYS